MTVSTSSPSLNEGAVSVAASTPTSNASAPRAEQLCQSTLAEGFIPCGARIVAMHPDHGLMAVIEKHNVVLIYKLENDTRFGKAGSHVSWHLADSRDLPARTGIRSKVVSMEFSPDGRQLLVSTTGRDALTTFTVDASGRIEGQVCTPPGAFKV